MAGPSFAFGRFRVDVGSRRVLRDGEPLAITAKAFDILAALVEQAGRVVDKDELMRRVWPDAIVEESNLSQQIFLLRKALGEGPKDHRFIATVPRRGYRFVADVTVVGDADHVAPLAAVRSTTTPSGAPLKLTLSLAPGPPLSLAPSRPFALAPDGRTLAYVAPDGATTALVVRRLDRLDAVRLARTDGASSPFFSPDSRWIGYIANGRLRKVPTVGGAPIDICEAGGECRGASWSCHGEIVFAPTPAAGLLRVSADGGRPTPATVLDFAKGERTHRWPEWLPDGRSFLFTIAQAGSASFEEAEIAVAAVDGGHRVVHRFGSCPRYVPTGHLVYMRGGSLMAAPFDLDGLRVTGSPMPVADEVMTQPTGAGYFSCSRDGMLVYLTGEAHDVMQRLVWASGADVAATGVAERIIEEPRLSPDGRTIAFGIRKATSDIWTLALDRGIQTRLTFGGDNFAPVWTRDGRRLTFSSNRSGPCQIFCQALDETEPTLLVAGEHDLVPGSWSPDDRLLLFTEYNPQTGAGIWVCDPRHGSAPQPLLRPRGNAFAPAFSPNGRAFAYASDESGRMEVYAAAFPDCSRSARISDDGGSEPVWSTDGSRLCYRHGSSVLSVEMEGAARRIGSTSSPVAEGAYQAGAVTGLPNYDVAGDGRLLLVAQSAITAQPASLSVTVNWFADIASRLA